jgi:hypothetical protein
MPHRLGLAGVHRDGEKEGLLSEHIETPRQEAISPVDLDRPTIIASYVLAAKRRHGEKIPRTFSSVRND